MKHKLFTFLLVLATSVGTYAQSGTCGDNLTWRLTNGVLTISGTGSMNTYQMYIHAPWYNYRQNITSVVIDSGITSIGSYAFEGCSGLTSVTIPNSVTSIGNNAFYGCSGLTSVTIPYSVTSVGNYAFDGCTSLPVYDNIRYADNYLIEAVDKTLTTYVINDGTKWIGSYAFSGCTNLTFIGIPYNTISIGEGAFYNCAGLTDVALGDNVTSIGYCAFYKCTSLASIEIPNSVTSIGTSAFSECHNLISATIGTGVASIGNQAFYNCYNLTTVNIPNSVTYINGNPFSGCTSLPVIDNVRYADTYLVEVVDKTVSSCSIVEGTKWIGDYAFYDCTSLASIEIPNSVTNIGSSAFSGCTGLTSVSINSDSIVSKVYYSNSNLSTIFGRQVNEYIIGNSVMSIGDFAFYGCNGLTSVTIPNSVTSIGVNAFQYCSNLTSVIIPNSVTGIGSGAFSNCTSLASVEIPNSVTSIGSGAFSNCTSLPVIDNVRYADTYLVEVVDKTVSSCSIVDGTKWIGDRAFSSCYDLISVSIPNTVTNIGERAFSGCYDLTSATIPNSVTSIEDYAFFYCSSLTAIEIPNSVTNVGNFAFSSCTSLASVEIPNSVTSIGEGAFYNCAGLTSVDVPESVISIGEEAFLGVQNVNYTGSASGAPWGALMLNGEPSILSVTTIRALTSQLGSGVTSSDYYLFTGVISSITEVNTSYGNATFNITDGKSTFLCYRIYDYHSTQFTSSNQLHVGDSVVISSKVQNFKGTTPEATQGRLVFHSANPLFTPDSILYYGHRLDNPDELKLYYAENTDTLDIPAYVSYKGQNYSVTEMAAGAFYNREDLTCVILPTTLKYMPCAFDRCNTIQSLYYNPISLTKPTKIPFSEDNISIQNIYIGEDVSVVPENVFDHLTNLSYVEWNALSCEDMEYSPFYYSRLAIDSFVIDDNIWRIPANLCWGIKAVHTLSIPSSVYYIGKDAFYGTNIREVNIPNTVETVGGRSFADCPLTKVRWDVEAQEDYEIFEDNNCITVSLDVSTIDWNNVYLYAWDKNGNSICGAWPGRALTKDDNGRYTYAFSSTYTTVNIIWNNGSDQTSDITDVTTSTIYTPSSSSGSSIWCSTRPLDGRLACPFYRSTDNITEFTFGKNVTRVPAQLCHDMKKVTSIEIPLNTTEIGRAAFKGCSKLDSLILNENVTSYGDDAFAGCSALTSIFNYRERPAKLGENTFDGVDYFNCTLYVLAGSVDMYKSVGSDWKDFYFVEAIGATSTSTTEVVVTPAETTADVIWPVVPGAETYELVIKDKNGEVVCTLIFNANGQLTQIAFGAPAREHSAGFSFTVTGLEEGKSYNLTLTAKDGNGETLDEQTVAFRTNGEGEEDPEGIEDVMTTEKSSKILRNGQIYILRGEKVYTVTGQEVR